MWMVTAGAAWIDGEDFPRHAETAKTTNIAAEIVRIIEFIAAPAFSFGLYE
jgi:hypothetical protein